MTAGASGRIRRRRAISALVALALPLGLAAPSAAYQRPGKTERVSVSSQGRQSEDITSLDSGVMATRGRCDAYEAGLDITPSGRHVSFSGAYTDLVPGDTNLACDVFVRDRITGKTERVSVASDGSQGMGASAGLCGDDSLVPNSGEPSISGDGRYVAFMSHAVNLVPGDTNLATDIFVHDRRSGNTRRVSVDSEGNEASRLDSNSPLCAVLSDMPSISLDGRHVAFQSRVDLDPNEPGQGIFVHDMRTGKTAKVPESIVEFPWRAPSLSRNGRFILYIGCDREVPGICGKGLFVLDRKTGRIDDVDLSTDGAREPAPFDTLDQRGHLSTPPAGRQISADGRFVTWSDNRNSLVPNDTNRNLLGINLTDVFVHDRKSGRTERISVSSSGGQAGSGHSRAPAISPNGRFVAFTSWDDHAFGQEGRDTSRPPPDDGDADIFVHDRLTGATEWSSISPEGEEADTCQFFMQAAMSNGDALAFRSCADNLVADDSNGFWDYFVRDRGLPVGVGGFDGSSPPEQEPPDDRICVTPDICIPPGAAVSSSDDTDDLDDLLTARGANLYGATLAYRPQYRDLFVSIELKHMPQVVPGMSPIFYGLRFKVEAKSYEVRATSFNFGTFGLFDCTGTRPACTRVADVRGGYGTTGMRVVFSLPLRKIGLEGGGNLNDVVAFSGLGTYGTGAMKVLDRVQLK